MAQKSFCSFCKREDSVSTRPRPPARQDAQIEKRRAAPEQERGRPRLKVLDALDALEDDEDLYPPEEQEGEPGVERDFEEARAAEQVVPAAPYDAEQRVERLAADPGLNAEPAARDDGAQDAGMFAPSVPNEARHRTGNETPYLVPACALSIIGMRTMVLPSRIVSIACHQFIPDSMKPPASV